MNLPKLQSLTYSTDSFQQKTRRSLAGQKGDKSRQAPPQWEANYQVGRKSNGITAKKSCVLPCHGNRSDTFACAPHGSSSTADRSYNRKSTEISVTISTIAELRREKSKPKGESNGYCKKEIHCFQRRQNSAKIPSQDALQSRYRKATGIPESSLQKMKRINANRNREQQVLTWTPNRYSIQIYATDNLRKQSRAVTSD